MMGDSLHLQIKKVDHKFVQFWYKYFQSTGKQVRDLPIKYFMSALDLVHLCNLKTCTCANLLEQLYGDAKYYENCYKAIQLEAHALKNEHTIKQRFDCVFCMKNFSQKTNFIRHMQLHTEEYKCIICNQVLNDFGFERHFQTVNHLKNVERSNQN